MSDIVQRLRDEPWCPTTNCQRWQEEAADEIERLRSDLAVRTSALEDKSRRLALTTNALAEAADEIERLRAFLRVEAAVGCYTPRAARPCPCLSCRCHRALTKPEAER